jgi:hypothetical protein
VLVVHGIDYNHNGLYDGTLDRSDLNRSIPGEATAPGLCGPLKGPRAKKAAAKGKTKKNAKSKTTGQVQRPSGQVFTASLATGPASADAPSAVSLTAPAWQCVLPGPADLRHA